MKKEGIILKIIDFHTHVYPDKIASRTVAALSAAADVTAYTDGTLDGLFQSMKQAGIGKSVILPVATRKDQFESINRFAKDINDRYSEVISFGAIHPDDVNINEKLRFLKEQGFRGIKLHPDYQETMINDERYVDIVCECQRLGMIVVTHAGKDPAYEKVHCPPKEGRDMLDKVYEQTHFHDPFFVFAHLGGNRLLFDVEKYLVGQNCYIDISCSFSCFGHFCDNSDEDVVRVIRNHGADKILFATDSPWNGQEEYIRHFQSLDGLSDKEKEMIFYQNAERLLYS